MKYLAYFILFGIVIGIVLRIVNLYNQYLFDRDNKRIMERRKKLWANNKASIEVVEELLEEITLKNNIENA